MAENESHNTKTESQDVVQDMEGPRVDPSYRPKKLKHSGTSIDSADFEFDPEKETRILVLYSGGTIGMKSYDGVYSPEPNYMVPALRKLPMFHDPTYAIQFSENEKEQPLVMPVSKENRRIIYCIYEYEPLLDSVNMTIDDYARIATDIEINYDRFDGFVVLHGTDTMAYTASALSFMLENLGKPVILTGSQIPIFETRSDGRDNFLGALIMAGHYIIPEVSVFFHNALLRGNRTVKVDSGSFDAFRSPNLEPLAKLEIKIHVNWNTVFQPRGTKKMRVHRNMCPNVGVLRLFPSITTETVKAFLQPPMQGVILQSYGAGNAPDARKDLMAALKDACDRGIIIINISQCQKGMVAVSYATGRSLLATGVIPGSDMSVEGCLMKLSYVLGKDEWPIEKKRKMMGINLRGELTATPLEEPSLIENSLITKMSDLLRLSSNEEREQLNDAIFPSLLCTAARNGSIEQLEKLKEAGVQFSRVDFDGRTALHVACCMGHEEVVRYILSSASRPSLHTRDQNGHTALDDAIRFKRLKIIKLLRQTGAHLNLPGPTVGMYLCHAVAHEDLQSLKSWHFAGADFNQGDYDKRTALHMAAAYGKENMVKYLIEHGANAHQRDTFGRTPIDEAKERNSEQILALLDESLLNNMQTTNAVN